MQTGGSRKLYLSGPVCVSMNQLITLALTEKVSALLTVDYLKDRAKRGRRQKFEAILATVPDIEPEDIDRL